MRVKRLMLLLVKKFPGEGKFQTLFQLPSKPDPKSSAISSRPPRGSCTDVFAGRTASRLHTRDSTDLLPRTGHLRVPQPSQDVRRAVTDGSEEGTSPALMPGFDSISWPGRRARIASGDNRWLRRAEAGRQPRPRLACSHPAPEPRRSWRRCLGPADACR